MRVEKAIVVRRSTRLEELVRRFNTRAQAKFYIEHAGGDFSDYEIEDSNYRRALDEVQSSLESITKVQVIDRFFMPNFVFGEHQVIVAVGQDGLVANAAKYVGGRPIVGVNPDPSRFDGILLPFTPRNAACGVRDLMSGTAAGRPITMAEVVLQDRQRLLAFNDFFIGARSHVSARYRISFQDRSENQSSSGVLVSTGAGSTGWLSSVFNMAAAVGALAGSQPDLVRRPEVEWDERRLIFVVREPFVSRGSGADIAAGTVDDQSVLKLESQMPQHGVIFSDGVESDYLAFNSGASATVQIAPESAHLVIPPTRDR
ncbi:MAG TPA: NAD+ kinase [Thermoanaerobaculia bacterium]|nr:NAD+ kinase [Thermoanaerobaculia bacterium]